jgi:hypothetical protein
VPKFIVVPTYKVLLLLLMQLSVSSIPMIISLSYDTWQRSKQFGKSPEKKRSSAFGDSRDQEVTHLNREIARRDHDRSSVEDACRRSEPSGKVPIGQRHRKIGDRGFEESETLDIRTREIPSREIPIRDIPI